MKILLGDFITKVGIEDIFKLTIENESSRKISNDNGVRLVNFVKSTVFPHCDICKHSWSSPEGQAHYHID
jgi:hypothetical protein